MGRRMIDTIKDIWKNYNLYSDDDNIVDIVWSSRLNKLYAIRKDIVYSSIHPNEDIGYKVFYISGDAIAGELPEDYNVYITGDYVTIPANNIEVAEPWELIGWNVQSLNEIRAQGFEIQDRNEFLRPVSDINTTIVDIDSMVPLTESDVESVYTLSNIIVGTSQVSYKLWSTIYDWAQLNGYSFTNPGRQGGDDSTGPVGDSTHPVTEVNHIDVTKWCNALTDYYNLNKDVNLTRVYSGDTAISDTTGFRLLTEEEWEYSARYTYGSGHTVVGYESPYFTRGDTASGASKSWDDIDTDIDQYAVYAEVSTFSPKTKYFNNLGIYDMSGNVWEITDGKVNSDVITKGGAWNSPAEDIQLGKRRLVDSLNIDSYTGFRICRNIVDNNCELDGLTISNGEFVTPYNKKKLHHFVNADSSISITPIVSIGKAIEIDGDTVISGEEVLIEITELITNVFIIVTAKDGITSKRYKLTISKTPDYILEYWEDDAVYTKDHKIINNTTITPVDPGYGYIFSANPELPNGLDIDEYSGLIYGIPTELQVRQKYNVAIVDIYEVIYSADIYITIVDPLPTDLSYTTPVTYIESGSIDPNIPEITGIVDTWEISPELPLGLELNTTSGIISGTPEIGIPSTIFEVSAINTGGSISTEINITVLDKSPTTLSYTNESPNYVEFSKISENVPTSDATIRSWSISPTLPDGLYFDPLTGIIKGSPMEKIPTTGYVVTATNTGGSISKTLYITVASNNANLYSLQVDEDPYTLALSPVFNKNITTYTSATLAIPMIYVTATVLDIGSTISINGDTVVSGVETEVPLLPGDNVVTITVTAEDGTTKDYIINVVKKVVPVSSITAFLDPTETSTTVTLEIPHEGYGTVHQRGICYSTSINPTIDDNVLYGSAGINPENIIINDLMGGDLYTPTGTRYYIRPFAVNEVGLGYGQQRSITLDAVLRSNWHWDNDPNPSGLVYNSTHKWALVRFRSSEFYIISELTHKFYVIWAGSWIEVEYYNWITAVYYLNTVEEWDPYENKFQQLSIRYRRYSWKYGPWYNKKTAHGIHREVLTNLPYLERWKNTILQ